MAVAVIPSSGASTSRNNITDEEGRWVIIGICLNKVLAPSLRKVLGIKIPKWYHTLVKPPVEIDKQTYGKFVKNLSPSTMKLNYDNINNNTAHKSEKMYDYAVKTPLSLAKLFLKPFMASFTGFDNTMDTSAVLSVMSEAQPFIACGADVLARKVRSDIRNEWAHCKFLHWTEPVFRTALNDIESLIRRIGLTSAEAKIVLDEIEKWRNNGIKLCFGNSVDSELIDLIRTEVGNILESVTLFHKDLKDKERLLRSLETIQCSLSREIYDLRHRQEITEGDVGRLKLEQLTLHNQCVSNKSNIQDVKNEIAKIVAANDEIPYFFLSPKRNPWFGGRLSELQNLENLLQLVNVSQPKVSIAAVCGLGGVGKTSLAIEYVHQKENYYTGGVYWFSGEDDTTFENSVYDVATRFGTRNDSFGLTFSATLAMICRIKTPWLVVLDNMDQLSLSSNIAKLVSGSWQRDASGHLLITTRRKPTALANDIRDFNERCCLNLKCFGVKEGKEFLFQRIRMIHDEKEHVVAEKLVQKLGGLPLALEQAAAYVKSLPCTLSQYLEQYDKQRLRLLNRQKATRVSEHDSPERLAVRTTWLLNFKHIKQTDDDGQAASRFLNASAFMSANEIQSDIINVGKPPIEDDEFCESVRTTLGRQQVLKLLTDFSLFRETISSNLSVHHLVQEVIQNNLNPEGQLQSITDAIRMLHYAFQSCFSPDELYSSSSENQERPSAGFGEQSRLYKWHKLCSHSYELVKHLKRVIKQSDVDTEEIFEPETARIVYECAIHLSASSKHDEAKKVANFAKDIFNLCNRQEISASSLFPLIIPLSDVIRRRIQYSCNISAASASRDKCEDGKGVPEHSVSTKQLDEMRLKGNDLFKSGYYNDALTIYCDAIDLSKKTNLFDARLLSNRASVYLKLGEYEKALEDAEEYILQQPNCWRGYARKALALVELQNMQEACVTASIAYYYNRDVFRNYGPFMSKFGSSFEMHLFVCHDTSDLSAALLMVKSQVRGGDKKDNLPIILLKRGDYHISRHTIDPGLFLVDIVVFFFIGNCIFVGCEDKCSVSFAKNLSVAFVNFFVAYNVNFTNNESVVLKVANSSLRSLDPGYTSLCCFGELKVDSCKFHNCIRGGLLVKGYAEVKNSEFFDNPGGLEVREGGRLLVSGSKVYGNKQGLLIGPQAKECVVEDCEIYDNEWGGIFVTTCASDIVIKGSRIYDNDESGISVILNSNVSIMGNEIRSNRDWGICIHSGSQAIVTKNEIASNQFGGICINATSCERSTIEYNDILFNDGPGICDEGHLSKSKENQLRNNKEQRTQTTAQSEIKLCYCCKKSKTNLRKCSKCYTAQYCGTPCQKTDWKSHKQVCDRLLTDGSIVLDYVREPIMIGHLYPNVQIPHGRAPGLLPVGPKHCVPPNTTSRFIVKMNAGSEPNPACALDYVYKVTLYDRSLTLDGKLIDDDNQIYELVRKYGSIGQLNIRWKKLFMWVQGPKKGKLRVFINEFPPYQEW